MGFSGRISPKYLPLGGALYKCSITLRYGLIINIQVNVGNAFKTREIEIFGWHTVQSFIFQTENNVIKDDSSSL